MPRSNKAKRRLRYPGQSSDDDSDSDSTDSVTDSETPTDESDHSSAEDQLGKPCRSRACRIGRRARSTELHHTRYQLLQEKVHRGGKFEASVANGGPMEGQ